MNKLSYSALRALTLLAAIFFQTPLAAQEPNWEDIDLYMQDKQSLLAWTNLQTSERALEQVSKQPNVKVLIVDRIYTHTKKEGSGPGLTDRQAEATLHYTVWRLDDPPDAPYLTEVSKELALDSLVPGLQYGLLGMRVGELRDIYIHPDYAYGLQSAFGPAVGLRIQVELIKLPDPIAKRRLPDPDTYYNSIQSAINIVP